MAIDAPFSGALIPMRYYGKGERVATVMLELNRSLYMDEQIGGRLEAFSHICDIAEALPIAA